MQERYLVRSFGDDKSGVRVGVAKLFELLDVYDNAVVVAPEIGGLKNTIFVEPFGVERFKELMKSRKISYGDGKTISLCTQKTLSHFRGGDIYLALWASASDVSDIESLRHWKALVYVTWLPGEGEAWERATSPVVIYEGSR